LVLAVGRLTYQKDFSTLLRAFATVREKMDARLVILGDGPDRRNLESLATKLDIENHVDFPGYVDNPYPYLKRADLFVLSSRYEGLPNVLIEAQICGAPIVSTDCPTGPDEILMKGRAGVLVPVGDAASMAVAMSDVLCDQSLARGFVESGQEELHRFTPEACYNAYMRLIDGGTN
jgi:glycosyltransferase involved in cell wall biosynthesis